MAIAPTNFSVVLAIFAGLTGLILVLQLIAWRWARVIEYQLRGQTGGRLARIIERLLGLVFVAQIMQALVVATIVIDAAATGLLRAVLILIQQVILALASATAMWQARRLQRAEVEGPVDWASVDYLGNDDQE